MIMLIKLFKDMKSVLSRSVRTFSRSGPTRMRSLKLRNRSLRINMMLRDVLLKILRLRETNRLLNLKESEQSQRRRLLTWKVAPRTILITQSKKMKSFVMRFNRSRSLQAWIKLVCKMSLKNGRVISLKWSAILLTLLIVMTEIEHFGKVSLVSLRNKRTNTKRISMRLR